MRVVEVDIRIVKINIRLDKVFAILLKIMKRNIITCLKKLRYDFVENFILNRCSLEFPHNTKNSYKKKLGVFQNKGTHED